MAAGTAAGPAPGQPPERPELPELPGLPARVLAALPEAAALLGAEASRRSAAEGAALAARAPTPSGRPAAVLLLLSPGADGDGDVVLTERASTLRTHAGQVAFPGGGLDPADGGDPVAAALREAREEVGVEPGRVRVLGVLPPLVVPPGGRPVTAVLGWEPVPGPLAPGHPDEVARVLRAPLAGLADPGARGVVVARSGWRGPAFAVHGLLVWGFTAMLLDALLRLVGRERDWDRSRLLHGAVGAGEGAR